MNIPPLPKGFNIVTNNEPQTSLPPLPKGFNLVTNEPSTTQLIDTVNYNSEPTNTVNPEDGNATSNVTMDMSSDLTSPDYIHSNQVNNTNNSRQEVAQEQANQQGFGQYTDTEGTKHKTTEAPLEDTSLDMIMMIPGTKLSMFDPLPKATKEALLAPTASEQMSREGKILWNLNQRRTTLEEAVKQLKGIPKEDQAITMAESLDLAKNYFGSAIGDDSILATKYGKRLEARKKVIDQFVATDKDLDKAKASYGNMKTRVAEDSTGMYSPSPVVDELDRVAEVYSTDPAGLGTAVKQIKNDLSEPIGADTALDIRENINGILRKPSIKKSFKAKKTLEDVKISLDSFLDTALPQGTKQLVDKEITNYREVINNKKFGDILANNTKADYAVNWEKVSKDIKKEGLHSSKIDMATPILKEFEKRFANDKYMGNVITPAGDMSHLNALGVQSKALNTVLDFLSPLYNRSRYKGTLIRKAITKSIKNSDNSMDFVEGLIKHKAITKEEAAPLKEKLMLEYKPEDITTGDVNLNPMYGTEKGTISSKNASEAALYDSQTNLVKETLGKGYNDDVIKKTTDLLNSKRVNSVIKATSDRLKADDIHGNMKMLQKTIQSETDKLVSRINKDHGVKLPLKEVEKLYRMKLQELLKDC